MKYRGQPYSGFQQQVPTIHSKKTLCYRGCKYNPYEPVAINQPETPDFAMVLMYRRVSYVVERHLPTKPKKTLIHC